MQESIDNKFQNKLKYGDVEAFEYLYKKWSGKIYNFILRISNNDQYLAEEIVQSVFIKIWELRFDIDPDRNFSSLLFTMAKNQFISYYRKELKLNRLNLLDIGLVDIDLNNLSVHDVEEDLCALELDELIFKAIGQLPPQRKRIFEMSRFQHLSNKEIATRLDLSVNTVESQMTKALSVLKEKLAQYNLLILTGLSYFFLNS